MMKNTIASQLYELRQDLNNIDNQLLTDFPESQYYETLKGFPLIANYHIIPPILQQNLAVIKLRYGQQAVATYHKLILCFLIKEALESPRLNEDFPESIVSFYNRHFTWVLQNVQNETDDSYYDYANDLFLKDLGVCSLRMFPFGAHTVELAAMSRRFIIDYGIRQMLEASSFYMAKMRRNTPFYHIHLDTRWVADFNQVGWHRFFKAMAEMLTRNPQIRGVFGSSWFYDPHLEKISPGLIYLRRMPEHGGAKVFKFGSSSLDIKNATYKSPVRQKLYEEGQYLPTSYIFIWPRRELIQWANDLPGFLSASDFQKWLLSITRPE